MLHDITTKARNMFSSRFFVGLWSASWRPLVGLRSASWRPLVGLWSTRWRAFLLSIVLTVLGGLLLSQGFIINGLVVGIISVGLDPLRAQFIAALIMTTGAACIGAALGRRRGGALVGGGIVFYWIFLAGFLQTQLTPAYDPGGNLEPLNGWTLFHTTFVMLGLGLLCAFIGAAVGAAFGEVVCDPLAQFGRFLVVFVREYRALLKAEPAVREKIAASPAIPRAVPGRWLVAGALVMLVILAASSGDLFIFSPDVGIHSKPITGNQQGQAATGTLVPVSFISPAMGKQSRAFLIYLPPSYSTPGGKNKTYPVLYMLHGSPGREIDWVTGGKAVDSADTLIAEGRMPELIMVFPDGNGYLNTPSEWGNSYDPRQQMETFVASDLVKYVDSHYRTIPDVAHRAIGGLSMGGFGAMNIAVHHPEVFGTVISLGGYYQAEGKVWGSDATNRQFNSPLVNIRMMPSAWKLHVCLGAATQDQPYYKYTQQFMQVLDELHVQYQFDLEKGYHSWPIWQKQFYQALTWLKWGDAWPPTPATT